MPHGKLLCCSWIRNKNNTINKQHVKVKVPHVHSEGITLRYFWKCKKFTCTAITKNTFENVICKICRSVASTPVLVCDWSEATNTVSVMWTRLIITFMWLFNLVYSVTVNDPRWRKYILGMLNLFSTTRETQGREAHTGNLCRQTTETRSKAQVSSIKTVMKVGKGAKLKRWDPQKGLNIQQLEVNWKRDREWTRRNNVKI